MTWRPIAPENWRPIGIPDLEPNAWNALRQETSTSVVAGPGAGKSEFLAQRAVYLLETGVCQAPQQILAISFKTDAAANLAARVRKRCPPELAGRFTSLTFDAFTKSLVDRFHATIPTPWRPTRPYDIATLNRQAVENELNRIRDLAPPNWQHDIARFLPGAFESEVVGSMRLPAREPNVRSARGFAVHQWWLAQLTAEPNSKLTFVSLNRLAELVVRANPKIARALRTTYPFVFVDEFQDTTYAQYDFLLSVFGGSSTIVTAVGDHKQRIMGWAGARNDAFQQFNQDFCAHSENLLFNFRSSPELVRVQHCVARALDPQAQPMQSRAPALLARDVVQVWRSTSRQMEGQRLVQWLVQDMADRGKQPRDYVLLVRQLPNNFEEELQPLFQAVGLSLRNESRAVGRTTVQDLLADDAIAIAVAALRLGSGPRNAAAWSTLSSAVYSLRGASEGDEVLRHRTDKDLKAFLSQLGTVMRGSGPSAESVDEVTRIIFEYLDIPALKRVYVAYARNDLLEIMIEGFLRHLKHSAEGVITWPQCIDRFVGTNDIPLMTVHKSKGLEYDTTVFIGLDDQSWWTHTPGNPDGVATFFVALSRAKQRAIFLFCEHRGGRRKVADLYQLLADAGVEEVGPE
ncbi:ATP-dependent helicase [Chromobacterium sp. ATCC 53434]|uniref:UvrD-helicase domain-containing protein n=1 Tax=Chromobacterium sp. (strain ATCC 53434 / SC 14030) TaxID=2059672 RepID=UPI000C79259C|nr:ATP-dependent helicase [Chromobacterium sp. ATCC 53434]AUH52528.1 ATP-dependent helicase [Chromobacterium sp. ATCC 53434]